MPSKRMAEKNELQKFCYAALAGKKSLVIGLDEHLLINLINPAAKQYFDLNTKKYLSQSYKILANYFEIDLITKILEQKTKPILLRYENILTPVIYPPKQSKYLTWTLEQVLKEEKCLGFLLVAEEIENITTTGNIISNNFLVNLINEIPGAIYFKDLTSKYLWCNDYVVKIAGVHSIYDIIGKTDFELCWEDHADEYIKNDKKVIANNAPIIAEESITLADGTNSIMLSYKQPVHDKAGKIIAIAGNSLDILSQKNIKKKLLHEKHVEQEKHLYYLSNFANSLPGSLYFKDLDGKYLWCNDFVVEMAGAKSIKELIGKTDFDMRWKNQAAHYRKHDLEVITSEEPKIVEESVSSANGEMLTFFVHKVPLRDRKGKIIGLMGNSLDITDRKKLENTLHEAKKNAEAANLAKTQFIANISHDIRTPLAGIIGIGKILEKEVKSVKGEEATHYLINSANMLLDLLNNVIEFSKLELGEIPLHNATFNLKKLINDLANLMTPPAQKKKLSFLADIDRKIPNFLIGDKMRIHRVLLNLIGNAIKFTEKGMVKISAHIAKESERIVILKIVVEDTGIGIPKDKQQLIFSKFNRLTAAYTGLYKGYGLGLAIVKQFIKEMGGEITVTSQENKGSTFTCLVPFQKSFSTEKDEPEKTNDETIKETSQLELDKNYHLRSLELSTNKSIKQTIEKFSDTEEKPAKYKILLVEDNELIQLVTKHQLSQLECKIEIADNAETAFSLIKKNSYDLILMDVGLPDKNGGDLANEIREWEKNKNTHTLIVALTAHIDKETEKNCLQSGMDLVLIKPLDEVKFKNILIEYIDKKNASPKKAADEITSHLDKKNKIIDFELLEKNFGYNKETSKNMLKMFMELLPESEASMAEAYQISNWENLSFHAHKLHGGAIYCGATQVQESAKKLETAINGKYSIDHLKTLYQQLLTEIEKLKTEYKKIPIT